MHDLIGQEIIVDSVSYRVVDVRQLGAERVVYAERADDSSRMKTAFRLEDVLPAVDTIAS